MLLSCEHASNRIPARYQANFQGHQQALESHLGWDIGAIECARFLAKKLNCPLILAKYSRLLIELNRSLHHPKLFSSFTRDLPKHEKDSIIEKYYLPYRQEVESAIDDLIKSQSTAIHWSIHSFTPKLNGEIRKADIAFLYDPKRKQERALCYTLKQIILERHPHLIIRMNYPYRGTADGFTTHLRKLYSPKQYLGIEIEMNQKHLIGPSAKYQLQAIISESILHLT